jgi:hypothetical protein
VSYLRTTSPGLYVRPSCRHSQPREEEGRSGSRLQITSSNAHPRQTCSHSQLLEQAERPPSAKRTMNWNARRRHLAPKEQVVPLANLLQQANPTVHRQHSSHLEARAAGVRHSAQPPTANSNARLCPSCLCSEPLEEEAQLASHWSWAPWKPAPLESPPSRAREQLRNHEATPAGAL